MWRVVLRFGGSTGPLFLTAPVEEAEEPEMENMYLYWSVAVGILKTPFFGTAAVGFLLASISIFCRWLIQARRPQTHTRPGQSGQICPNVGPRNRVSRRKDPSSQTRDCAAETSRG